MGQHASAFEKEIGAEHFPPNENYFGLINYGNTCYCNAVLQALYFCRPFRQQVLNYKPISNKKSRSSAHLGSQSKSNASHNHATTNNYSVAAPPHSAVPHLNLPHSACPHPNGLNIPIVTPPVNGAAHINHPALSSANGLGGTTNNTTFGSENLLSCLNDLYTNIASQKKRTGSLHPKKFVARLRKDNESFDNYLQQDAHEFLNFLLNTVADILKSQKLRDEIAAPHIGGDDSAVSSNKNNHNSSNLSSSYVSGTNNKYGSSQHANGTATLPPLNNKQIQSSNNPLLSNTELSNRSTISLTADKNGVHSTVPTAAVAAAPSTDRNFSHHNQKTTSSLNGGGGISTSSSQKSHKHSSPPESAQSPPSPSLDQHHHRQQQEPQSEPTTWIHDIFQGVLTSETVCLTCETVRRKDENFLDLSLDIVENNSSVTHCLRHFSHTETLHSDHKFFCETCCSKQEARKCMKLKKLPQVLAIHLKRFKFQENLGRYTKLAYRVVYPLQLRLFNTSDECPNPDVLYELVGVVIHAGSTPNRGHYITMVRSSSVISGGPELWLLFDDDNIEKIDPVIMEEFFGQSTDSSTPSNANIPGSTSNKPSETAYILFYQAVANSQNAITSTTTTTMPNANPINSNSTAASTGVHNQSSIHHTTQRSANKTSPNSNITSNSGGRGAKVGVK